MGYPYYGRTDIEGRRFDDDRERWEERDYDRGQREGTRFDENRWRGRERPQGYSQGSYAPRDPGERHWGERGGPDHDRDLRSHERYYPGQGARRENYRPSHEAYRPDYDTYRQNYEAYRPHYESYRQNYEDERYGREPREHDDRNVFERFGDRVREGLRRMGRGPKGFKRSDERITEDVCERIARSHINADNVEVKVKDGEVTLMGFVEFRYDKRNLEDIADDVFGVTEVHNQLRVQPQTAQRSGTTTSPTTPQTTPEKGRVTHS